jgi:hypothetical protein
MENALSFVRENQIRNYSIPLSEDPTTSAATYYMDSCFVVEKSYLELRKNLPIYFNEAEEYMDKIEEEGLCDYFFIGNISSYNNKCKQTLGGLLNKGLT